VVLGAILTSASQKVNERAIVLYDLADSAYDATEIKVFSSQTGHIPIIDQNKRRGESVPWDPAKKIRYRERSSVERTNSDVKDNYLGRTVRVRGYQKVFNHLMFSLIAITVKQMFRML
jgi:hypothetical protein